MNDSKTFCCIIGCCRWKVVNEENIRNEKLIPEKDKPNHGCSLKSRMEMYFD